MAAGINLSLVANVREFITGTKDASRALEDVADSLDDLARDAERDGDRIERSMRDVGEEGERAGETLQRSFQDAFDAARKESSDAMRKVGDNTRVGMRDANNYVGSFKDEARQNFTEVASSWDGSLDGILNGVQGLTGGLAASLGPAGLGIAILGAGAAAFYQHWKENSEKTKQAINTMYEDMKESGKNYVAEELIQQAIDDIIKQTDDAAASMDDIWRAVKLTGLSEAQVIAAYAGDMEARTALVNAAREAIERYNIEADKTGTFDIGGSIDAQSNADAAQNLIDKMNELNGSIDDAAYAARLYNEAIGADPNASSKEAEARRFENIRRSLDDATTAANNASAALAQIPTDVTVDVNVNTSSLRTRVQQALDGSEFRVPIRPALGRAVV